ncbi:hypothetical protein K6U37_04380 [Vibrio parahaemolyticus]|uniref:hypothetical protein n=1 Tax=Vibrio parahaemolyticus TaxID=670 RepID=UPI001EEAEF24|nr:hypothetical protein [Vibrio parahaemolyticus]MCG6464460.1 hypothetical protein [Vibrio parahaemolyticus]MCG6488186.1 hypothetical protein [Vibrio parahaemolyticus]
MARNILLVVLAIGLTGCTAFNVWDQDDGSIVIIGHATVLKDRATVFEEVKEKAEKVCDGKGYDVVNPATGKIDPNYNPNVFASTQSVSMRIKCKNS